MLPIITIQGPTAVGKSALAIRLAEELKTEIISADSRQVYKFLDIGTSKPSREEREKIKHHLIDIVFPDQEYNAGKFRDDATLIAEQMISKGKIPIIVGGTGFYLKALLQGIFDAPAIPKKIREKLRILANTKGKNFIRQYLEKVDPESAQRIDKNDVQKMIRALEIWEVTGIPISEHWKKQKTQQKFQSFDIFLTDERDELYRRINARFDKMLKDGLLEEIQMLLAKGYKETDPGMITVGYREFYPYFHGEKKLPECVEEAKKNTRNYAKRQFTWFGKQEFDLTMKVNHINFSEICDRIYFFLEKFSGES
ncbi:MAG: tRNA (adenosine(37)-N6)-dimethylallyltransferase MiaA [Candidatus Cloacimonadota bacterium]|nr:MAG: tRNA (adenosine(37)-N6)-dimethylallyltransferase MiaA [Candidatus Cloacimonadota bacterium]